MAESPHCIRLSTAWEPPAERAGGEWVRRFGRPAPLGERATGWRIDLVWVGVPARLTLNGVVVADSSAVGAPCRHDVTGLLQPRNDLRVVLAAAAPVPTAGRHGRVDLPPTVGAVWLEITAESPGSP